MAATNSKSRMIDCPDCRKPVSRAAEACPQCGRTIRGRRAGATTGGGAVAVLASIVLAIPSAMLVGWATGFELVSTLAGGFVPVALALIYASRRR